MEKKQFIEPELIRYEEKMEEVTLNNYQEPICPDGPNDFLSS